jgi:hypothetical protein
MEEVKNQNSSITQSMLEQAENALDKAEKESVMAKVKELVKKRKESEKVTRAINLEIEKMISDYANGLS